MGRFPPQNHRKLRNGCHVKTGHGAGPESGAWYPRVVPHPISPGTTPALRKPHPEENFIHQRLNPGSAGLGTWGQVWVGMRPYIEKWGFAESLGKLFAIFLLGALGGWANGDIWVTPLKPSPPWRDPPVRSSAHAQSCQAALSASLVDMSHQPRIPRLLRKASKIKKHKPK